MRRMIAQKQAEGLKKLNENIVINDSGTQVEIGGNVVIESAEQIGIIDSNGEFKSLFKYGEGGTITMLNEDGQYVVISNVG